jgi:hypothetical protein
MNLVHMRHTGSLKAYVCNLNIQINAIPKFNKFSWNLIFLGEVAKVDSRVLEVGLVVPNHIIFVLRTQYKYC